MRGEGSRPPPLLLSQLFRLLGYGLSTTGVKAELRARLEEAMLHFRAQHKTWDSEKMAWV